MCSLGKGSENVEQSRRILQGDRRTHAWVFCFLLPVPHGGSCMGTGRVIRKKMENENNQGFVC